MLFYNYSYYKLKNIILVKFMKLNINFKYGDCTQSPIPLIKIYLFHKIKKLIKFYFCKKCTKIFTR